MREPTLLNLGSLGDVMKESCQIAYTFARHYLEVHSPDNRFFDAAAVRYASTVQCHVLAG